MSRKLLLDWAYKDAEISEMFSDCFTVSLTKFLTSYVEI